MYCFKIPHIKRIQIINIEGGITAEQIRRKYNPDWLCNLALYDNQTRTNITLLESNNKTSGYLFTKDGIGITNSKALQWCTYEEAKASDTINHYVSGSPVLMRDQKACKDFGNKYSAYVDQKHKRTLIGLTKNKELVLAACDYSIGLDMARDKVKAQIPDLAYLINGDGGGSVHLQHKNKKYVSSGRKNVSWLLIWEEPLTNPGNAKGDDEMVEKKKIKIDGVVKECEVIMKDGRTYVQLRDFESMGYEIGYTNGMATIHKPK